MGEQRNPYFSNCQNEFHGRTKQSYGALSWSCNLGKRDQSKFKLNVLARMNTATRVDGRSKEDTRTSVPPMPQPRRSTYGLERE